MRLYREGTLSPTALSCSACFVCSAQECVCGKTGSENSFSKSKAWKRQLSLADASQMCTDVTIRPRGTAPEAMTWIELKGFVWLPLFREN